MIRLSFVMQTPLECGEGAQRGSREARAFGFTPVFSMTFVCKGSNTVSNVSTQRTFKCAGHIRYGDRMQTGVPCWKITPHSDAMCIFSFPLLSVHTAICYLWHQVHGCHPPNPTCQSKQSSSRLSRDHEPVSSSAIQSWHHSPEQSFRPSRLMHLSQ